jgi:Carboxypeptidase regulatory-like domain
MNKRSDVTGAQTLWLLLFTVFILGTRAAPGAITFDNSASEGVFNGSIPIVTLPDPSTPNLSWTHQVNTCKKCVLYIGVTTFSNVFTASSSVFSISYTPSSGPVITPTLVGSQMSPLSTSSLGGNSSVQVYRIIAPPVGVGTILVTFGPLENYAFGSSFSFNGVNQGTPDAGWALNNSSGMSAAPGLTVSGDASGNVILDILGSTPAAGSLTRTSGQTVCYPPTDPLDESTCTRGRRFYSYAFDVGAMGFKYTSGSGTVDQWTMDHSDVWALGAVPLIPDATTAGDASIQGQLVTKDGQGVSGAIVYAQDDDGGVLTAISNPFGYFTFEDLTVGKTYILRATSKRYDFQPLAVTLNESAAGVRIIAITSDANGTPEQGVDAYERGPTSRPGSVLRSKIIERLSP